MKKNKIFLGGTCAQTTWRDKMIKELKVPYFNPVVEEWTEECLANEIDQKDNHCNIHFYMITKEVKGFFSIAEVIESAHKNNIRTFLQVDPDGFNAFQLKSLKAVVSVVNSLGGIAYINSDISKTTNILNSCFNNNF